MPCSSFTGFTQATALVRTPWISHACSDSRCTYEIAHPLEFSKHRLSLFLNGRVMPCSARPRTWCCGIGDRAPGRTNGRVAVVGSFSE